MYPNTRRNNSPGSTAKIAIAWFLSIAMTPGHTPAALVERDWQTAGDAALTYDTATGLEWLDLTLTSDQSYNEISAQLGTGETFEGFVYAASEQVTGLFDSADLPDILLGQSPEWPKIKALLELWGTLWFLGATGGRSEFIIFDTDGLPAGQHWTGRLVYTEFGDAGVTAKQGVRNDDFNSFSIGSALVRPAKPVTVDGDVNRDGSTNLGDLLIIQQLVMGKNTAPGVEPGHADFYPPGAPDGIINLQDLVLMRELVQ